MKKNKQTIGQQWIKENWKYHLKSISKHEDIKDANEYALIAWKECKKRCIEILEEHRLGHFDNPEKELQIDPDWEYFSLDAKNEINNL